MNWVTWFIRFNLLALCIISPVLSLCKTPVSVRLILLFTVDIMNILVLIVSIRRKVPSVECALVAVVLSGLLALYLVNRAFGII